MKRCLAVWTLAALNIMLVPAQLLAHFPWLVRNADNKIELFFGEGLGDRTYKLPPAVAQAKIQQINRQGQANQLSAEAVEQADFVGLRTKDSIAADQLALSSVTYGLFRGSKLQYTAIAYGQLPRDAQAITFPSDTLLQARLIDTDSGVTVSVTWDGKPLSKTKVTLYDAQTEKGIEAETDSSGSVSFSDQQVQAGLNAIRVGHKVDKEGKLGNEAYSGEMHYLTATFVDPESAAVEAFAALPFAITSFGAATDGKALYVFGGHMGGAHSYSFEEQSDKLLRLDLSGDKREWQAIATGNRVQGTAMVAFGDELIVVGGFQARNKAGEAKSLHSLSEVRSFNTKTQQWSSLPDLPEPRSSHDAAIVGTTVYVVGGWHMHGDDDAQWHKTAWKMDLSKSDRTWDTIANPPFERRAVAVMEHAGKLVVVGGMNQDGGPTKAVALFDPETKSWSSLPDIEGEKAMAGFGTSGWSVNGRLVITSQEGKIEELVDGNHWKIIGETKDARFFHRVLPVGGNKLVAIGGANMSSGKFTDTELIVLGK